MPDDTPATTWLPLAEAAPRLGLTLDALRQRVRRGQVTARRGNDKRLLVEVDLRPDNDTAATELDSVSDVSATGLLLVEVESLTAEVTALRAETASLRDELVEARVARAQAEAERDGIRAAAEAEKSAIAVVVGELKAQLEHGRGGWWRRIIGR